MKKIAVLVLTISLFSAAASAQGIARLANWEANQMVQERKASAVSKEAARQQAFQAVLQAHEELIKGGLTEGDSFTQDHAVQQMFTNGINLQNALTQLAKQDAKLADTAMKLVNHKYYVATLKKSLTLTEVNQEAHSRFPDLRENLNLGQALKVVTKK